MPSARARFSLASRKNTSLSNINRVRHRISRAREACCCEIARRLVHGRHKLVSLLLHHHIDSTVAFHSPIKHGRNVLDIARALFVLAPHCHSEGVPVTQMARQIRSAVLTGSLRRTLAHVACALHNLPDGHDIMIGIVNANLQIRERGITSPWDTRRHISNHSHNAALAAAAGRTTGHGSTRAKHRRPGRVNTC